MNDADKDNPEVIAMPPLIYLAFLLVGLALDYLWPVAVLPNGIQYIAGFAFATHGGIIVVFDLHQYRKAHTKLSTLKPTTSHITGGPFRVSRNPSFLSLCLLFVVIGIAADNLWVLGLLVPTLALMHYGVIFREERYLERKFGEEYLRYKASVRRWL